jgi:hypothetical protein
MYLIGASPQAAVVDCRTPPQILGERRGRRFTSDRDRQNGHTLPEFDIEEEIMTDIAPQTASGKVLFHFLMSLDGFVAGPGHTMDFMARTTSRPGLIQEYIETTGAVLAGRAGFDSAIGDSRPFSRAPSRKALRRCAATSLRARDRRSDRGRRCRGRSHRRHRICAMTPTTVTRRWSSSIREMTR